MKTVLHHFKLALSDTTYRCIHSLKRQIQTTWVESCHGLSNELVHFFANKRRSWIASIHQRGTFQTLSQGLWKVFDRMFIELFSKLNMRLRINQETVSGQLRFSSMYFFPKSDLSVPFVGDILFWYFLWTYQNWNPIRKLFDIFAESLKANAGNNTENLVSLILLIICCSNICEFCKAPCNFTITKKVNTQADDPRDILHIVKPCNKTYI